MPTSIDIQNLRQQVGDSAVYTQMLSDPDFKAKVERVQQANPQMTEFEKLKFPSAMLDIHLGKTQKSSPIQQQTAKMVNTGMQKQNGTLSQLANSPLSYAGQTAMNILPSTGRLIGGVVSAVAHPLQTTKSIFQLGVGGVANTIESIASLAGVKNAEDIFDLSSEEVASAVGDFYVQRYGSLEAAATTLRDDPAGFLSDLGAVVTGVGGILKGGATAVGAVSGAATRTSTALSTLGKGIRATQGVGQSLIKTGINMEPLVITGKGVILAGRGVTNATVSIVKGSSPAVMATKALKINPSDIRAFQNLKGGELPGDFLLRKGVLAGGDIAVGQNGLKMTGASPIGRTRAGIMTDLDKIAVKARSTVNTELAGVRQMYNIFDDVPPEVPKLMDEILTTAKKYDLKEPQAFIETLLSKERVSLTDINELKRLAYDFFNTYKRSNLASDSFSAQKIISYEQATRKFIEDQAAMKGLPDIGMLNQDIQKSYDILDAMKTADAASWSKGKLTFGLMDGMFAIGSFGITGDFMTTAGIVIGRKILESTLFKTTFAKYVDKLDPSKIKVLQKAFQSMKHTTESKKILRKVVAQTADDIKNQRIADSENVSRSLSPQPSTTDTSQLGGLGSSPTKVPEVPNSVNGLTPATENTSLGALDSSTGTAGGEMANAKNMTLADFNQPKPKSSPLPSVGGDLMKEARKFKSAEEFTNKAKQIFDTVREKLGGDHNVFVKSLGKDGMSLHEQLMNYLSSPEVLKLYEKGMKDSQILKDFWNKANPSK